MIVQMARIRILGPRERFDATLRAVQDFGKVHLADVPAQEGTAPAHLDAKAERRRRQLLRVLADVDGALAALGAHVPAKARARGSSAAEPDMARVARLAARTKSAASALADREAALRDERALLERYRAFADAIRPAVEKVQASPRLTTRAIVIPAGARPAMVQLEAALREELGAEFTMSTHPLASGDLAVVLVLPAEFSTRLDDRLAAARLPEVPLPSEMRGMPLDAAIPRLRKRLAAIPSELDDVRSARDLLAYDRIPVLLEAKAAVEDWLGAAQAHERGHVTAHAFTVDGWVPEPACRDLVLAVHRAAGPDVVIETVGRERWGREDAPVALTNPRLFRPFEALLGLLPLPRYGSIDPTPFVAVFFPLIFGMMLGDAGYGALLAIIALVVHRRSAPGSLARTIAEIAGPCAAFAIVFGVLFGEYFGDLAHRLFHVPALLVSRETAILSVLAAAVALGAAHVLLGLVLGAITSARSHPREALGRGVSAVMVILVIGALLAAVGYLPKRLSTPATIAVLVAFPLLVVAEGIIAPVELLATFGNILSYARIMAIGTASVMLAVVANEMVGAMGSAVVGLLFALLFHLVNFAIGLFSPAIHALRLHYVEFFGKFYSPGGTPYRPFRHGADSSGLSPTGGLR
jgi:V/A-type H+-transporting ATPase subunit I